MSKSPKLMAALDSAAFDLLKENFPTAEQVLPGQELPATELRIKAFAAVVNYYGPRTKLGGDEEGKTNEYTRLKDRLHGRGKARRRASEAEGGADPASVPVANGSAAHDPDAGL